MGLVKRSSRGATVRWNAIRLCVLAGAWSAGCSLFPDFSRLQGGAQPRDAGADALTGFEGDEVASDAPIPACTGFAPPQYMQAPAPATSAGFGAVLTTDGDTLVVVAPQEGAASVNIPEDIEPDMECPSRPIPNATPGAIYAYTRDGENWPGGRLTVDGEGLISRAVSGKVVSDNGVFALNNFALTTVELKDRWLIVGEAGDLAGKHGGSLRFFDRFTPGQQLFELVEERTTLGEAFGTSFALSGRTLVVGAPRSGARLDKAGAVFVYDIEAENVTFVEEIVSPDPQTGALFGARVALSNDWLIVGAPNESAVNPFGVTEGVGTVYAFHRSGKQQEIQRLPGDVMLDKLFGSSLALDGSTLLVGAPGSNGCANRPLYDSSGVIHHYELTSDRWREVECITPNSTQAAFFGYTLALTQDRLAVGAPFSWNGQPPLKEDGMTRAEQQRYGASGGLVYLYDRAGRHFHPSCVLAAPMGEACDIFGESVSIGTDVMAVGAFGDDSINNSIMDSGAVYLYRLPTGTP